MIQNSITKSLSYEIERTQYDPERLTTRVVWITNYNNNEDFSINVPISNLVCHNSSDFSNAMESKSSLNDRNHNDLLVVNKALSPELSKLSLDDLLLLLYRLQQKTTKPTTPASTSTTTSSSSSFIADVPKRLTTTLAKPVLSFHSQQTKQIHSPNDVVDKLLQSFHLRSDHIGEHSNKKFINQNSSYTYQESQEHKARLISSLLSSNSIRKSPSCSRHN